MITTTRTFPPALHGSGPTWAAVFALGVERDASEEDLLKAFVCGFEIGASFGSNGLGVRLNESGWHSTAVLGRIASATAASYLLRLAPDAIESALGLAATQAGGLTASFGTMAKPFHAGKAAVDGITAAQFAAAGLQASKTLFDSPKGLFGTIFQDRSVVPSLASLNTKSELLLNSLKPYAACQLAHAPIDAARLLREKIGNAAVESIKLQVNPLAIEIASVRDARTPTEGRFSTGYCVALAMYGYPVSPADFVPERLADRKLIDLAARVSMEGTNEVSRTAARLEAKLADGSIVKTDVEHAFGSVGNPMDWKQLELKFQSLVEPIYGDNTATLYDLLANFERAGALKQFVSFANKLAPI
ncbi:MAG: MmgE/PrpD family protein [Alphaproteobacteria bacterium]